MFKTQDSNSRTAAAANLERMAAGATLCVALGAILVLAPRQAGFLSVQGRLNLNFAGTPSFATALRAYPLVRPPLYPTLLWGLARLGISPRFTNELLLAAGVILVHLYARRILIGVAPAALTLLFAILAPNYENLYQCTAEMLVAPLMLGLALVLDREASRTHAGSLVTASLLVSALCVTRYFSLFSVVPIFALVLWRRSDRARGGRLALPVALALLPALFPALVWMGHTYHATGYLTGADRIAERQLPEQVRYWHELRGLRPTLWLTQKTLFIDFFSPASHAALSVVTSPYHPSRVEWALAFLALLASMQAATALAREGLARAPMLVLGLLLAYFVATLALWGFGNNDPVYTRFLYPSYPLLLLAWGYGYAAVQRSAPGWLARAPFLALWGALAVVHLTRSLAALPVPFR